VEYIFLHKSDLKVSRLGFGCCPMGGHGWGSVSESEFRDAIAAALDMGINFFDTADIYGIGESERRLGRFLKSRWKEVIISTKFGVRKDNKGGTFYDSTPKWLDEALDASLARLGVDHIDLYQVHYLDGRTPVEDTIASLEAKRAEGKIKYYGFSNISLADVSGWVDAPGAVSFQEEYSLSKRDKEKEIEAIYLGKGLSFISWGSLGQGVLTGKFRADTAFGADDRRSLSVYVNFHGEKLVKNINMVENIKKQFMKSGMTISQIAIRWILDRFDNSVALVGIKRSSQLFENAGALGWKLSGEEMAYLDSISRG
jgi:aryl-alcohol dehydrogenase-like predicted oxidoreductase